MIVWLASYPRSGNTFLRIVINRLYGSGSSTVYPVDGVRQRLGGEVVVAEGAGASVAELRSSREVHFVKTHRRRDFDVGEGDVALYLVRDGRDAVVSFARQRTEETPERFSVELKALIERRSGGTGSWGQNVLSWLLPEESAVSSRTALIRFEDLTRDPIGCVTGAVGGFVPDLPWQADAPVPTFADLHRLDGRFFRRGLVGTYRDEMPGDLEELFWSYEDNCDAMGRLGYERGEDPEVS